MTRYHPLLVALHWLMAVMIVVALAMGNLALDPLPNDHPDKIMALRGHMTVGVAILVLLLVRLVVRLRSEHPPVADAGHKALNLIGRITHWLFYALVFAMCASGLATAFMTGLPGIVFGGSGDPLPRDFSGILPREIHDEVSDLLIALILVHVVAAIYHQVVLKDSLLRRMWFGNRKS